MERSTRRALRFFGGLAALLFALSAVGQPPGAPQGTTSLPWQNAAGASIGFYADAGQQYNQGPTEGTNEVLLDAGATLNTAPVQPYGRNLFSVQLNATPSGNSGPEGTCTAQASNDCLNYLSLSGQTQTLDGGVGPWGWGITPFPYACGRISCSVSNDGGGCMTAYSWSPL